MATHTTCADTALKHPESPGFVVRDAFLGAERAAAAHEALVALAATERFHAAKVGHGEQLRSERAARGDRIHWLKRPRASESDASDTALHPAILHLLRRVERMVFGVKAALAPDVDIRNVTSTQFAIFVSFSSN